MNFTDKKIREFLETTLILAKEALEEGNYPIGVIIVDGDGNIIGKGKNTMLHANQPAGHAEINAFNDAGEKLDEDIDTYLFSSLEPCFGCAFFTRYTNIVSLSWALTDTYKGGFKDLQKLEKTKEDFDRYIVVEEPFADLAEESRKLLYDFFIAKGKLKAAKAFE